MANSNDSTQAPNSSMRKRLHRKPTCSRFTQQEIHYVTPILSPKWVIKVLIVIGVLFIPIGIMAISASHHVVEVVRRYDAACMPKDMNYTSYIQNPTTNKDCHLSIIIPERMKKPIFIYYELTKFYQNHRRYMEDKNDIIASSLFNDTYSFSTEQNNLSVSKKDISWSRDPKYKSVSEQEDLMVWIRVSPLPTRRKLYGVMHVDFEANQTLSVLIKNNYNCYIYGGQKKIVLSTASWLGGRNNFLGIAFLTFGGLSLFVAIVFTCLHYLKPRRFGDPRTLSWRK